MPQFSMFALYICINVSFLFTYFICILNSNALNFSSQQYIEIYKGPLQYYTSINQEQSFIDKSCS